MLGHGSRVEAMGEGLAVTALGMVTSVGVGAAPACAAIRAGLTRPRPLAYFSLVDPKSGEPSPLIAHPIRGFSDGFQLVGRWLRLAHAAIRELFDAPGASAERPLATAIVAALPLCDAARFGIEEDDSVDESLLDAAFLAPLCELSRLPISAQHRVVVCEGHAAAASALSRASALLQTGSLEQVIVVGVDSYLDPGTLEWLHSANRLHGSGQPEGLVPGEAAAALLVTSPRRRSTGDKRPLAFIPSAFTMCAKRSALDAETLGVEWSRACTELLAHPRAAGAADLIVDLNGERWRSDAFGNALPRMARQLLGSPFENPNVSMPAASIGDVGASTGCIHACLAVRSFARRYSHGPATIIVSQSDDRRVGAILMRSTD